METNIGTIKFNVQKQILIWGVVILLGKFLAYFLTNSIGILTDAFESIVNVVAAILTLLSLHLASKPRDLDHPYGHGKIEMLTASIEGILIILAGVFMISEAVQRLFSPVEVKQLNVGILIVALGGLANYLLGFYSIRVGKKHNSIALIAGGKHLQSDTYSTIGLLVGLGALFIFNKLWIDSAIAIVFGVIIIVTGVKILKETFDLLMDRADFETITEIANVLYTNRQLNWIDIHNLKAVKYGNIIHLDCDLTLPWYMSVREAHNENDLLKDILTEHYTEAVDITVHFDGCKPAHCQSCRLMDCKHRTSSFVAERQWILESVIDSKALGEVRFK